MHRTLPVLAVALGVLGLLPFLGCGIAALQTDHAGALLGARALIAYAGVVLGFLGGVHWGFALDDAIPAAEWQRLVLGVLPALLGWVAMLLSLLVAPAIPLALLIAVLIAMTTIEARGRALGFVPRGYMALRWGLSVCVVAILTGVLVLRVLGGAVAI